VSQCTPFHCPHDILARNNADEISQMVDNRQTLHPMFDHQLKHSLQSGIRVYCDDLGRHDLVDCCTHAIHIMRQNLVSREGEHLQGIQFGNHADQSIVPHDWIGLEIIDNKQPIEVTDRCFGHHTSDCSRHVVRDGFLEKFVHFWIPS